MKKITIIFQDKLPGSNAPFSSPRDGMQHASGHFLRLMSAVTGIANNLAESGHACFFRRMSGVEQAERGKTTRLPVNPLDGLEGTDLLVVLRDMEIEDFDHVLETTLLGAGFPIVVVDPLAKVAENEVFKLGERIAWCRSADGAHAAVAALLQKLTP